MEWLGDMLRPSFVCGAMFPCDCICINQPLGAFHHYEISTALYDDFHADSTDLFIEPSISKL